MVRSLMSGRVHGKAPGHRHRGELPRLTTAEEALAVQELVEAMLVGKS